MKGAMEAGGRGVSIGRNVFQHPYPDRMVKAISMIVNEEASVEEAMEVLK